MIQGKQAPTWMLFWGGLAIVNLVLFFVIPNTQSDASLIWVTVKWLLLAMCCFNFLRYFRYYWIYRSK